jgi:hypothetical protein
LIERRLSGLRQEKEERRREEREAGVFQQRVGEDRWIF